MWVKQYTSDLIDRQWQLLEPMLVRSDPRGEVAKHTKRGVVNIIFYVLKNGVQCLRDYQGCHIQRVFWPVRDRLFPVDSSEEETWWLEIVSTVTPDRQTFVLDNLRPSFAP